MNRRVISQFMNQILLLNHLCEKERLSSIESLVCLGEATDILIHLPHDRVPWRSLSSFVYRPDGIVHGVPGDLPLLARQNYLAFERA